MERVTEDVMLGVFSDKIEIIFKDKSTLQYYRKNGQLLNDI